MKQVFRIDDREYSAIPFPVIQSVSLHAKAMKALGNGLIQGLRTVSMTAGPEAIGIAILGALTQADTESITEMIPEVMSGISVNGKRLIEGAMGQHFEMYPADLYPVFAWGLEINIRPFIEGSAGGWKAFMNHLGLASRKDGKKPGFSRDR